jgi:hypothetical protein
MHEAIAVEYVQPLTHASQPPQSQGFAGGLLLLFSQKREDAGEFSKRRPFNPGHQGDEVVLWPFPRHLEDRRKRRMTPKVRARQAIGFQDSPSCFRVVPNFGDVSPEVLFC